MGRRDAGFTLVELLVVLAAMGLLLGLVMPRYAEHVSRSREVVLKHNLVGLREAIDKFRGDRGRYPASLDELVTLRYLRELPVDPITERADGWLITPPPEGQAGSVFDVHSAAHGVSRSGEAYASW